MIKRVCTLQIVPGLINRSIQQLDDNLFLLYLDIITNFDGAIKVDGIIFNLRVTNWAGLVVFSFHANHSYTMKSGLLDERNV